MKLPGWLRERSDMLYTSDDAFDLVKRQVCLALPNHQFVHTANLTIEPAGASTFVDDWALYEEQTKPGMDRTVALEKRPFQRRVYVCEEGACELFYSGGGSELYIDVATWSDKRLSEVYAWAEAHKAPPKPLEDKLANVLHALVKTPHSGIQVRDIGEIVSPFQSDHYDPSVREAFGQMLAELTTEQPIGKLFVLSGPPGTGKSSWVRSVISEAKGLKFVWVHAQMLAQIASPEMLAVFLDNDLQQEGLPTVLIVEEADALLVERHADNMSAMQTMLNLCDGILGDALNIRVIATTNARNIAMDAALLRPGRQAMHLSFGPLLPETIRALLKRLVPEDDFSGVDYDTATTDECTLAGVYRTARKHGWKAPEPVKITDGEDRSDDPYAVPSRMGYGRKNARRG